MMQPEPTRTPGMMTALEPTQVPDPIVTGLPTKRPARRVGAPTSCVLVNTRT